ncbi:MAG TPA: hypothetical protein VKA69_08705, partial [Desulfobacteria bacterium]|nr:hypothetical protein [Desulfobacteria bacterium]
MLKPRPQKEVLHEWAPCFRVGGGTVGWIFNLCGFSEILNEKNALIPGKDIMGYGRDQKSTF